jgi:hypothetical protein
MELAQIVSLKAEASGRSSVNLLDVANVFQVRQIALNEVMGLLNPDPFEKLGSVEFENAIVHDVPHASQKVEQFPFHFCSTAHFQSQRNRTKSTSECNYPHIGASIILSLLKQNAQLQSHQIKEDCVNSGLLEWKVPSLNSEGKIPDELELDFNSDNCMHVKELQIPSHHIPRSCPPLPPRHAYKRTMVCRTCIH